jgi:hypothetical protein
MSEYLEILHDMAHIGESTGSPANMLEIADQHGRQTLHQIGELYCTDKSFTNRTGRLSYLQIYELYFDQRRDKKIDLLEIGVRKGESMDLWYKYFSNGEFFGIDIDETWWLTLLYENVHFIHADATKPEVLERFDEQQSFDIIIDDGSHINKDIISSFEIFWPRLKSKGVYVIEDLYNSYGPSATTRVPVPGTDGHQWVSQTIPRVPISSSPPLKPADPEIEQILGGSRGNEQNNREQLREWLNQIEKNLNNPQQDILYIHHWDSIIVIGKV